MSGAPGEIDLEGRGDLAAAESGCAQSRRQQHLVHVVMKNGAAAFVIGASQADGERFRQRIADRIRMTASFPFDHLDVARIGMRG